MTISPSILAMPSPALRICSHQPRPWARQVEAKVPAPPRPRHARATGVQGRAIADRHARIQQPNGKPVADARWELRLVKDQLPVARAAVAEARGSSCVAFLPTDGSLPTASASGRPRNYLRPPDR